MAAALVTLRQQGRSLLLVEQRVDLALQVCDRIYVLVDGRIIDERRSREVVGDQPGAHRRLSRLEKRAGGPGEKARQEKGRQGAAPLACFV